MSGIHTSVCTFLTLAITASAYAGAPDFRQTIGDAQWQSLLDRLAGLNHDIRTHGMRTVGSAKLLTGYAYNEFYDWDLYFENIYLSYYGINDFCFTNLEAFLAVQQPDGFISRSLKSNGAPDRMQQQFKPFLAQAAVLGSRQRGDDFEWLRAEHYEKLKKYLDRWFAYDADHNGLPVWDSADASGMDNQTSRAGGMHKYIDEGVDLACELHRELHAMAIIAKQLGKPDEANDFTRRAARLAETINKVFWDDTDGFYYDRNEKAGKLTRVKSVAGFFPLWAGVAPRDRAARIVKEHLLNEKEFWTKFPVASYALTEPDFYEGRKGNECNWRGTAWISTNYIIFHGLIHYGYKDVAHTLAMRTFDMALNQNPMTREYYDSDTGKGNGMKPFWGWSSLAYVMPLEEQLDYDPTDLDAPIKPILKESGVSFDSEPATVPSK